MMRPLNPLVNRIGNALTLAVYPHNANARYFIDDVIPHYDHIPVCYQDRADIIERNAKFEAGMLNVQHKRSQQQ